MIFFAFGECNNISILQLLNKFDNMQRFLYLIIIITISSKCYADISPKDYGWNQATTDKERYIVLQKTHQKALILGTNVDYSDMGEMNIEVPYPNSSILVSTCTDFKDAVINVRNNVSDQFIFQRVSSMKPITIEKELLDGNDFSSIPELSNGTKLLVIEDKNVWTKRISYGYDVYRKDILLLTNGIAENTVICPYSPDTSKPICLYCEVSTDKKVFQNLTFNRTKDSTCKSFLIQISGENNFSLNNLKIFTPSCDMVGDRVFYIENSTNLTFDNIKVEETYSSADAYGYAISLENIWNSKFTNLAGNMKWGYFGNNNINTAILEDCDINRFDVHSYGKDIYCSNCTFKDCYNQYSSLFGTLTYNSCHFINFTPILLEYSYNAFTPFEIIMNDCIWDITSDTNNYIVNCSTVTTDHNTRQELYYRYLPEIKIHNLTINSKSKDVYIYSQQDFSKGYPVTMSNQVRPNLSGITINADTKLHFYKK